MNDLGFYSIVRYVDDVDRGETVNVGVLLEAGGHVLSKFVSRDDLEARNEIVERFAGLIQALIERGDFQDAEDEAQEPSPLRALSHRGFPHFDITEPRQLVVNGDSAAVLDDLARRLASDPAMSRL